MPSVAADANSADPIDRIDPKPNYLVLVYSVGRPAQGEQLKDFPPTFLLSAAADRGPPGLFDVLRQFVDHLIGRFLTSAEFLPHEETPITHGAAPRRARARR